MPYDVTLVEVDATFSGFGYSGLASAMNFPSTFSTLVYSQWICGPLLPSGSTVGIGPAFAHGNGNILFFNSITGAMQLGNTIANFFIGSFSPGLVPAQRSHVLVSIDTINRVIQVYVNDIAQTVSGTWTGAPGSNHYTIVGVATAFFMWDVANTVATTPARPAIADPWCWSPPSFIDLSIVANRRKFINRDLTPVYLGSDGSAPFGVRPQIYSTVQSGGVPNDLLTNLGTGAAFHATNTLSFPAPGLCTLPPPPPPTLAMDNVVCTATATQLDRNLISLRWSDDRGHVYGSPVTQDIGEAGEYRTSLQWQRCGYGRDRVWELSWSVPMHTALQGAWIDVTPAQS